jgi:phage recombination protein Bet
MTNALTTTNGAPGAVTIAPMAPAVTWTPEMIATAKATIARGSTDEEFALLLHLAKKYDLDPFAKEIWCVKQGGPNQAATIMASRDGYLKAAQRDPSFMGLQAGVVRKGDTFAFNATEGTVEHSFGAERGPIQGAWAIAHHRLRMPVCCFVDFAEYKGTSPIWGKYPSAMIQKVAEVFALKRQFGINGLVTKEELDTEAPTYVQVDRGPADNAPAAPAHRVDQATGEVKGYPSQKQMARAYGIGKTAGLTSEQVDKLAGRFGAQGVAYIVNKPDYDALCELIPAAGEALASKRAQAPATPEPDEPNDDEPELGDLEPWDPGPPPALFGGPSNEPRTAGGSHYDD